MILFDGGAALLITALWLFCLIDVITTPDGATRNLPKIAWVFIVILLFDLGAIAWLVAGRPWQETTRRMPYRGNSGRDVALRYPEYDRPGRSVPSNPDDDDVFLAGLRARAEEQRRRAAEEARRRAAEEEARHRGPADDR